VATLPKSTYVILGTASCLHYRCSDWL